jgi:hypothetical protein
MIRMCIKSKGSRQVHSCRASSTSRIQFGGIQDTGGGKRSTPRTVAGLVEYFVTLHTISGTYHRETGRPRR